ncbi:TIGR03364 family FAD-dependent oxidoreductase [Microbacterium gorillae]|uniref:TIGR03364 family FAD-dependent oxidoreductase n=1 Tax=Microbacterium gorillae TaxID=1231063 RepID=UPI00058F77CE|nr:TIGR03364 family FAD-dependent oxidoreductase [Microbacterium gorillae]
MNDTYDLAVVGAGIIGLGAAYAALKRGLRVIVVDRQADPQGATVRNFGHLCIGEQTGAARVHADRARELWLELGRAAEFWVRESGTLIIARHEDERALLEAAVADDLALLTAAELDALLPSAPGVAVGGARVARDLQTDARSASAAIRRHLASRGVEFRLRTSAGAVGGGRVQTSRGPVSADLVVVAVNHDLDQLLPELAESVGVVRCGLDMLRARIALPRPLPAPLLTGWSLLRYGRFSGMGETAVVRQRLHAERPDLAALDLNQMYTPLPDGTILIGDTHVRGASIAPFQPEAAADALADEVETLFGARVDVLERWQGVYASGPDDFLVTEPDERTVVLAATTGIGMTTGLGLAENTLAARLDALASTEGILR